MNEQDRWDAEDSVAFRKKLRGLRQALDKAREAEVKAMTTYHAAKKARQQAQVEIEAAIEAEARPLPLFDNLPHGEVVDAEDAVVPDPPELHPVALSELGLSTQRVKRLRSAGYSTVGHLVELAAVAKRPLAEAIKQRFFGERWTVKGAAEVQDSVCSFLLSITPDPPIGVRRCKSCRCTASDCSRCIVLTGLRCEWSTTDLSRCTACVPDPAKGVG